jgi:hypothetical protein
MYVNRPATFWSGFGALSEIFSAIGAGGMERCSARDTRLDRAVAIKVLSGHVSGDPAYMNAEREKRTVAARTIRTSARSTTLAVRTGPFHRLEYLELERCGEIARPCPIIRPLQVRPS